MSHSRRAAIFLFLGLCGLSPAPAFAQASGRSPGAATASLVACQAAADQADRSATFSGQMVATAASSVMQMRIDLLESVSPASGFAPVSAPGLGTWRGSAPGVQIYRDVRQFTNLPAPGRFRASIDYRWLDAHGRVLRQLTRLTPICVQPDERPLLAVATVAITPSAGSLDAQYAIALVNEGRGPAGPFDVALTVNGTPQPDLVVQSLAAGTRTILPVVAPRCTAGSSVTVTIDPQNALSEAPGGGLPKTVACPLATATP